MSETTLDIVLRRVPHYGWMYLIQHGGAELARGEFKRTPAAALAMALGVLERLAPEVDHHRESEL